MDKLYFIEDLLERYRVSESAFYVWIKEHNFPAGAKLGGHRRSWIESELQEWESSRRSAE